jgi:hypothetical protein
MLSNNHSKGITAWPAHDCAACFEYKIPINPASEQWCRTPNPSDRSFTSDMGNTPQEIQDAIGSDDTDKLLKLLRVHPERSYEELQDSLTTAIATGSLRIIEILLDHGATLKYSSYDELSIREEPAVFKQLIDHGWDINSTEFEQPPVQ